MSLNRQAKDVIRAEGWTEVEEAWNSFTDDRSHGCEEASDAAVKVWREMFSAPVGGRLPKTVSGAMLPAYVERVLAAVVGMRSNPMWKWIPRVGWIEEVRDKARERDGAVRALEDAKRLPISRGMIRGALIEISCPRCFARALIERGASIDMQHRKSNCDGTPFLAEVHALRPSKKA